MPVSWILVEWTDEDECSVIPSSWVKTPNKLPLVFPVKNAVCRWKDNKKYDASLLAVSDSRAELEAIMPSRSPSQLVVAKKPEAAGGKRGAPSPERGSRPASKKRMVKATPKAKAQKSTSTATTTSKTKNPALSAQGVTNTAMSTAIELAVNLHSCKRCEELEEQLDDKLAAVEAKKAQIEYLQQKLSETERKLEKSSSCPPPSIVTAKEFPVPSSDVLRYLDQLISHFSSSGNTAFQHDITDAVPSDLESDFEEEGDYEAMRRKNIEENQKILKELGIRKFGSKEKNQSFQRVEADQRKEKDQTLQESSQAAEKCVKDLQLSQREVHQSESCGREKDQAMRESAKNSQKSLKTLAVKSYSYDVTPADLSLEQEAFEAGEGKKELFPKFGVYIKYIQLEQAEQMNKKTATGLMRGLISVYYRKEMLAACSATNGINPTIRTAIFKYCEQRFPGTSFDTMTRQLTSKCGEERRSILEKRKKENAALY